MKTLFTVDLNLHTGFGPLNAKYVNYFKRSYDSVHQALYGKKLKMLRTSWCMTNIKYM